MSVAITLHLAQPRLRRREDRVTAGGHRWIHRVDLDPCSRVAEVAVGATREPELDLRSRHLLQERGDVELVVAAELEVVAARCEHVVGRAQAEPTALTAAAPALLPPLEPGRDDGDPDL